MIYSVPVRPPLAANPDSQLFIHHYIQNAQNAEHSPELVRGLGLVDSTFFVNAIIVGPGFF